MLDRNLRSGQRVQVAMRMLTASLLAFLALAATASATNVTVVGGDDPRFANALAGSYMPTPPDITVDPSGCPSHPDTGGCSLETRIWIVRGPDDATYWDPITFLHEVGHVVSYDLGMGIRSQYMQVAGESSWNDEFFADVYAECARYAEGAPRAYTSDGVDSVSTPDYGYIVHRDTYNQLCALTSQDEQTAGFGPAPKVYSPPAPPPAPVAKQPVKKPATHHTRPHKRSCRHLHHHRRVVCLRRAHRHAH